MALFSGSLASALAVRAAQAAGIADLQLVFFRSPFFLNEEGVARLAQSLGLPLRSITLKREFLRLRDVDGLAFPCGSCRKVLLERAGRLLRRRKFDVVVTGEIVGKGALSAEDLTKLDEEAGLAGRVLRPLSAKLLPPTALEQEGQINRHALLDLSASDPRLEGKLNALAKALGLPPRPKARRCLLSDPFFARRCQEFGRDRYLRFTANFVRLLEFPHLFRLPHGAVLVVATTPAEQVRLQDLFLPEDVRLYVPLPGSPLGLLRGPWARLTPEARGCVVRLAAQKLLILGGFDPNKPWTVCFRAEEAEETARLQLSPQPLQDGLCTVN